MALYMIDGTGYDSAFVIAGSFDEAVCKWQQWADMAGSPNSVQVLADDDEQIIT